MIKVYNEETKKWFCRHCFEKFIEINQSLKYQEQISHIGFIPPSKTEIIVRMRFYKTKKLNPIFINEEGIIKIGECNLHIDKEYKNKNHKIKVTMKFGGTFIDVTAIL